MYSAFDCWAYWSHMLTAISMFSPCTQWVFGPLSPVSATAPGRGRWSRSRGVSRLTLLNCVLSDGPEAIVTQPTADNGTWGLLASSD